QPHELRPRRTRSYLRRPPQFWPAYLSIYAPATLAKTFGSRDRRLTGARAGQGSRRALRPAAQEPYLAPFPDGVSKHLQRRLGPNASRGLEWHCSREGPRLQLAHSPRSL